MVTAIRLGPRLRAIAAHVVPGRPLADICCDHAQLAAALVTNGRVPHAIAADLHAAPLEAAARALAAAGVTRVELRQADGLDALSASDDIATVVIAGVGAPLCELLIERGRGALASVERLIVQPNHGFPKLGSLRAQMAALGLEIIDETLVGERDRLYVTLIATVRERDAAVDRLEPIDRELGPILRRGHDPLWPAWLARERARAARAIAGIEQAGPRGADAALLACYRDFVGLLDGASC